MSGSFLATGRDTATPDTRHSLPRGLCDPAAVHFEPWSSLPNWVRCAYLVLSLGFFTTLARGAEFIPLGSDFFSEATGISKDGSVVVGSIDVRGRLKPFRWTSETGMQIIAPPEFNRFQAYATDVSADGSIVVGADFDGMAFRLPEGGDLELLGNNTAWEPSASADASVLVGRALDDQNKRQATHWTQVDGRTVIGPPASESNASDISDDGTVVAGTTSFPEPKFPKPQRPIFYGQAFVWSEENGHQLLGGLPGFDLGSKAWAISPDGSAVVGVSTRSAWPNMEAFMWTEATGMIGLGQIPGRENGVALDVSRRGEVVVGYSADVDDPREWEKEEAFIWDQAGGMRSLQSVLEGYGLTEALAEWTLTRAIAITGDGLHIAGRGINPLGDFEAWLVHLDPLLQAGDADQDLDFDQLDLVQVQVAGKYLGGQSATWGEGDWDAAPGGEQGNPPPGNGRFDQLDIVAALSAGKYLTGPYGAIALARVYPDGMADGQTSLVYNAENGEVFVDAPAGRELTSIIIDSAAGIFTGDPAQNLGGRFDHAGDGNIFKATFGSSFGSFSFGNVAPPGLSKELLPGDLTVVGSLAGGGDLGDADLIYVPEPASCVLLAVGILCVGPWCRRRRRS